MRLEFTRLFAPILLALPQLAIATPVNNGIASHAEGNISDCLKTATGCDYLPFPDRNFVADVETSTHDIAYGGVADIRGEAWSQVERDETSFLPVLKAYAHSTGVPLDGTSDWLTSDALGIAYAVQGFRYIGSTPFHLEISATATAVFSDGVNQGSYVNAGLSIFDTEGYRFNTLGAFCPIGAALPQGSCANMPEVFAHDSIFMPGSDTATATISYNISPGETIYVGAYLSAHMRDTGVIDAAHTMRMQFNDATNLESFPVSFVPEPSQYLLLLAGLAVLLRGVGYRRLLEPSNAGP